MKLSTKIMLKHAISYGIVLGIILTIWLIFDYVMGYYGQNKTLSNLNYLARMLGVFVCTLIYRNKVHGGYISFGEAFTFGLLMFVVAMILLETFVCLLVNYVDPDYLMIKAEVMRKQLHEVGLQNEQIGRIKNVAIHMERPVWAVVIAVIGGSCVGALISLLSALILKKDKKKVIYKKRNFRV